MTSSISQAREVVSSITNLIQTHGIESFSEEVKAQLANILRSAANTIQQFREERPENVDQLYLLAGGNKEAFQNYLRTYPNARANALLGSPLALHDAEENLQARFGEGIDLQADGFQHSPLMSSTVYGSQYDPNTGSLKVRFNNGGIYEYGGVPPQVFDAFQKGAATAKTEGENEWGEWWVGKTPSLGASLNQYLKAGNFPYKKLR